FASRRRHTSSKRDWSADVCSSDLAVGECVAGVDGAALRCVHRRRVTERHVTVNVLGRQQGSCAVWAVHLHPAVVEQRLDGVCLTDRKSTRLNSSHVSISYAVFCLK